MRLLRRFLGGGGLLALAVGLNVLVFKEELFIAAVLVPVGVGMVCGLAWLALSLTSAVGVLGRGRTVYGVSSVSSSVIFFLICAIIYAFAKHWNQSWDLTKEGRRQLSEQTVRVLENLSQDVSVVCFFVKTGDSLIDVSLEKTRRFLERCQGHTSHLKVEFLDPQVDLDRLRALNVQRVGVEGTVVIQCGARQKVMPLSDVTARLEERDFTNALVNVVRDAQPKVCFLTGHREHSIMNADEQVGASSFATWLKNEAYVPEPIAISITHPEIPSDCGVLVIDGPQSDLHPVEVEAIEQYMERGGRMLVLLDPWLIENRGPGVTEQLRPYLEKRFGIVVGEDVIVSKVRKQAVAELVPDIGLLAEYESYEEPGGEQRGSYDMGHPITRGFDQKMVLPNARSVSLAKKRPEGVAGVELLRTLPDTWAETNLELLAHSREANHDKDEREGPIPVAVAVTAKCDGGQAKEARVVVVGDSDFTLNDKIKFVGHHNFLLNAVAWLTESEELIAIRPVGEEQPPVVLSAGEERAVAWISSLAGVQAVIMIGLVVRAVRRKYR